MFQLSVKLCDTVRYSISHLGNGWRFEVQVNAMIQMTANINVLLLTLSCLRSVSHDLALAKILLGIYSFILKSLPYFFSHVIGY